VFVLSAIAGAGAYFLEAATTTAHECITGSGGSDAYEIELVILGLAVPVLVGVRALRTAPTRAHAAAPVVVSLFVAALLIFLGASIWWSNHNCMT
jgi:small neutral amino acid transporter SnatA (MarC family)